MDVRLSPEQQALRDSGTQIVDRLGPDAVGQLDDLERVDKLDAAVLASGWRQLRVSEPGGEPLASAVEVAIVAEELGRGLADTPFLGPTLAAELRRLAGACPATAPETVALSLPMAELALSAAGEAPSGAVAVDARGAASALVLLAAPQGHVLATVSLGSLEVRTDLTRPAAAVDRATEVAPIGQPSRPLTVDDLADWTAMGLALTSADLVGTMRGVIDLTVAYAAERRQFGRPIGSFQAVQHLLADAFVLMEGSRSIARHAAWAVDALPTGAALAAAAGAKAYCARAARTVCETSIQVHGGIGNTWECLAHVFLRRALLSSELLGGAGASLERVLAHHGIGGGDGLQ
ncbi:MAG TPA: acyl-CoA dehydrogenase family protein [Acidimicrobiales bacterium]|nr:acyl-CoA dehydrogenase family protein [Acidimicrobiales bacterium]